MGFIISLIISLIISVQTQNASGQIVIRRKNMTLEEMFSSPDNKLTRTFKKRDVINSPGICAA